MSCDLCRLVQADQGGIRCEGIETVGECPEGKIPTLAEEHHEIWDLFQLMLPGLITQGGYDYNAVGLVFESFSIAQEKRPLMFRRIKKMIDILDRERRKRAEK